MLIKDNSNLNDVTFFNWETTFDATVLIDDCIYPNTYNVNLSFLPKSTDIQLQNNSFDRLKYLFGNLCENSLIINPETKLQAVFFQMPINKVLLPGKPYDQLFWYVLYHKMIAISGKYLHIGHLTVDSKLGDNVQYSVDEKTINNITLPDENWISPVITQPWWDRNDTATFDQVLGEKEFWTGPKSWRDLGYGSDAPKKSFNPTILDGGRD